MITAKLYGLLRIESGIKEKQLEAATVKEVLEQLAACGIDCKDLNGCVMQISPERCEDFASGGVRISV